MTQPRLGTVLAVFVAFVALLGAASLRQGALLLGYHEGDALHLLEILLRMSSGETPHVDYMTPLGALAFLPIVFFMNQGLGAGQAILSAQVLVAAGLLPAVWWVAVSRLSGIWAYVFGIVVFVIVLAVVHGDDQRALSISMHYNRWAWAAAFALIACVVLEPVHRKSEVADGLLIGALLACLALTKVTYAVAFFPAVVVALIMRQNWRTLAAVAVASIALAFLTTLYYGIDYWGAYISDLLTVARSETRPFPGEPFAAILAAPPFIPGTLLVLGGIIVLRQLGRKTEGLILMLLTPGFIYVTYQNFGNVPQWLVLLGILMFAALPAVEEGDYPSKTRTAGSVIGIAALALSLPFQMNMLYSPFRLGAMDRESFAPLIADPKHQNLMILKTRLYKVNKGVPYDEIGALFAEQEANADRPETVSFQGKELARCEISAGELGALRALALDLEQAGFAGARIFTLDVFSSTWLLGNFDRLENGAPWYYSGSPGLESATHILVPGCPIAAAVQREIAKAVNELDLDLTLVRDVPLYALYRKN
ncbi:MAG: hypothetical protein AAFQ66_14090 [Pseudomonadota bacterium]